LPVNGTEGNSLALKRGDESTGKPPGGEEGMTGKMEV